MALNTCLGVPADSASFFLHLYLPRLLMRGGLYSGGALVLKCAHGGFRHAKNQIQRINWWLLVEREKEEGIRWGRGLRVTNYNV